MRIVARAAKQGFHIALEKSFDQAVGEVDLDPGDHSRSSESDLERLLRDGETR